MSLVIHVVFLFMFIEFQLYRNVELDMSLHCPGESDYSCPHWDHLVHLTVCCNKKSPQNLTESKVLKVIPAMHEPTGISGSLYL